MSVEHLYPFGGNHAIQNVTFAIEWSNELTNAEIINVHQSLEPQLKAEFSRITPQNVQKISFNMDSAGSGMPNVSPIFELSGFTYDRPSAYGNSPSSRSIVISKNNLLVQINEYSRWEQVWADVERYFSIVLVLLPKSSIVNIGLQYSDIFTWKDDLQKFDTKKIFRENSPFLVPNVHSLKGLWHSHHGYLVEHNDPQKYLCLDNVNVNLLDTSGILSVQIVTSHRATFATPIWYNGADELSCISKVMALLHHTNKSIIFNLLSDEVCRKINLKAS
ncbi:MAG: hypothetical protein CTY10_01190 [Methylotenera sp.]|nr:MAG: hypothetical protein CTY10_01190 [Methylotenera sp.]